MKKFLTVLLLSMTTVLMAGFSSANGVVTDDVTTLEWQDDYSDNAGAVKLATWEDAIIYCDTLSLVGSGWRLPNIRELRSIVDRATANPSIDRVFQNTATSFYWSSTTVVDNKDYSWAVYLNIGIDVLVIKSVNIYVRCVRDGQ